MNRIARQTDKQFLGIDLLGTWVYEPSSPADSGIVLYLDLP